MSLAALAAHHRVNVKQVSIVDFSLGLANRGLGCVGAGFGILEHVIRLGTTSQLARLVTDLTVVFFASVLLLALALARVLRNSQNLLSVVMISDSI